MKQAALDQIKNMKNESENSANKQILEDLEIKLMKAQSLNSFLSDLRELIIESRRKDLMGLNDENESIRSSIYNIIYIHLSRKFS